MSGNFYLPAKSDVAKQHTLTPGTYSWTCPTGVTELTIKLYGGGGGGRDGSLILISPQTSSRPCRPGKCRS